MDINLKKIRKSEFFLEDVPTINMKPVLVKDVFLIYNINIDVYKSTDDNTFIHRFFAHQSPHIEKNQTSMI